MRLTRWLINVLLWICYAIGWIIGAIALAAVMVWIALAAGYAAGRKKDAHGTA